MKHIFISLIIFQMLFAAEEPNDICWLAILPIEIQKIIASYLSLNTRHFETDDYFYKHLQSNNAHMKCHFQKGQLRVEALAGKNMILYRTGKHGDWIKERTLVKHQINNKNNHSFMPIPKNEVNFFTLSPQLKLIAALIDNKKVKMFSESGKLVKKISLKMPKKIRELAVSDDGFFVALADGYSVLLMNLKNKKDTILFDKMKQNFGFTSKRLISLVAQDKNSQSTLEKGYVKAIAFNKQNTKIGLRIEAANEKNYSLAFNFDDRPDESLATYFKHRGVCKNWPPAHQSGRFSLKSFFTKYLF